MLRPAVATIALIAGVTGCASAPERPAGPYQTAPRYSAAMNVLMANGAVSHPDRAMVRDAPAAAPADHPNTRAGLDAGYAVANAVNPAPGFGLGAGLALSALSLLDGPRQQPEQRSQIIAWMPVALESTPEEARDRLQELLDEALSAALEETLPTPYSFSLEAANFGRYGGPAQRGHVARVTGGRCSEEKISCGYRFRVTHLPEARAAPDFVRASGPAWTWPERGSTSQGWAAATFGYTVTDEREWRTRFYALLPDIDVYIAMSRRLPPWVYIYLAPGEVSGGAGKGWLSVPVVLSAGRLLEFKIPEEAQ